MHCLSHSTQPECPCALRPQVYKLYGGASGFLICTNVAEPDEQHAPSLLQTALHLQEAAAEVGGEGEQ